MKAELVFGMRFMYGVPSPLAYRQALATLAGEVTVYTPGEEADLDRRALDQARRVLLGSVLDRFDAR
jgi:hypothetical protein